MGRTLLVIGGRFEGQWHRSKKWPHPLLLPGDGELPFGARQFQQDYWRAHLPRPQSPAEEIEVWVWGDLTEEQAVKRLRAIWPRVRSRFHPIDRQDCGSLQ